MTYRNTISRLVLSAVLIVWAVLFIALAFDSDKGSLSALLFDTYGVPFWASSFLCFGTASIFAWSGFSALLSKTWEEERFETVAISMSAALGVAMGFAGLTPQSEFWQFAAQIGMFMSLLLTGVAAGLLLAVSTMPVVERKLVMSSNDNDIDYARRTKSTAYEVATFQTLKDRW